MPKISSLDKYEKIPDISLSAFDCIANYAYNKAKLGYYDIAIEELSNLHWTLLQWCKHLAHPEEVWILRMTMKIIRMELAELRQKLTVDPS